MSEPDDARVLRRHALQVALLRPQIAPNTGNVARLCVATATTLHLVRPMGFVLSDRQLKRSAMDYWERLEHVVHDDFDAFMKYWTHGEPAAQQPARPIWWFDSSGETSLWDVPFRNGDVLVFGSETRGVDLQILRDRPDRVVRIPQAAEERCLNLSTAVGIALYEALRRISRE